ncbi:hypothetical protein CTA2_13045, partial [Colletotrichum tanaceti]
CPLPLKFFGLTNVELSLQGSLTLSDDPETVSAVVQNRTIYPGATRSPSATARVSPSPPQTTRTGGWMNGHNDNVGPVQHGRHRCERPSDVAIDGRTSYNGGDIISVSPPAVNVTMRNAVAYRRHGISASCSMGRGSGYLFENADIHESLLGACVNGSVGTTCQISDVNLAEHDHHTNTACRPPESTSSNCDDEEKGEGPAG